MAPAAAQRCRLVARARTVGPGPEDERQRASTDAAAGPVAAERAKDSLAPTSDCYRVPVKWSSAECCRKVNNSNWYIFVFETAFCLRETHQ